MFKAQDLLREVTAENAYFPKIKPDGFIRDLKCCS